MFESYNSSAHQSAVDRLIQLATGKKNPAPEEEQAAPPSTEARSSKPVEAAAEPSEAEKLLRLINGPPPLEVAPEQVAQEQVAPEAESWAPETAPLETAPLEEQIPLEEKIDDQPFDFSQFTKPQDHDQQDREQQQHDQQHEEPLPLEVHFEAQPSVEEYPAEAEAAEPTQEPGIEAAPEQPVESGDASESEETIETAHTPEAGFEHAVEPPLVVENAAWESFLLHPHSEPASAVDEAPAVEETVDDRPFHEAPLESAPIEAIEPQAEAVSEPAVENEPPAVEAEPAKEEAAKETVAGGEGDDRPFHAAEEIPVEGVLAAAGAEVAEHLSSEEPAAIATAEPTESVAEPSVAEPEEIAAKVAEPDDVAAAVAEAEVPAASKADSASNFKDGDDQPFDLEQYLRLSANNQHGTAASGPDVVPSPTETTFLSSKGLSDEPTEEEIKELAQDPMWKTLMKFKGWLPMVTSMLPLLDLASGRNQSGMGTSEDIRDSMAGLLASHRDVRNALHSQTSELKRVEEEVALLRDVSDKAAFEQASMSDDMKSVQRLLKNAFLYVGILLGLLVVAVAYMAFLVFSYLNHPMH